MQSVFGRRWGRQPSAGRALCMPPQTPEKWSLSTGRGSRRPAEKANLEKAIEIKRRAQRCVQNGDLDGALNEYEKLVASDDSDPYNYVLIADLLDKKGEQRGAAPRYLSAGGGYRKAGLHKNGI